MADTARHERLRTEFQRARGYWSPVWDMLLEQSPDFFEAYLDLSSVPWRGGTLPPKVKELIYIAIDSSTTHLYSKGTRVHIRNALRHGATREEILEVLQLTSVLGIHTITEGVPAMLDELRKAGKEPEAVAAPLTARQEALKAAFIEARGYWSPMWDGVLALAPDFFEAYLRFSSVPWRGGPLEPKVKELIYVAIDAATTHLYDKGTRIHMANAIRHGATAAEVMEVLQLVSVLGIHTMTDSLPILEEECKAAGAERTK